MITYVKRYGLNINIYLFVDNVEEIKIMHYQKPFIKLVSNNLKYIIKSFSNEEGSGKDKKIGRMFEGLHRRIMVKVLDEDYAPHLLMKQEQIAKELKEK